MENKIEKLLKLENGDKEKVNKVLNRLKHILKDTQTNKRTNEGEMKSTLDKVNFKSRTENDLDILDNANKPLDVCVHEPNISEFYNEHNIDNNTRLKDIAENHRHILDNIKLSHEGEVGNTLKQTTDPTSEIGDKCKQTADHISELDDKCKQTTDPTSEVGGKCKQTTDPTSEVDDKCKQTTDPTSEVGDKCKQTTDHISEVGDKCKHTTDHISEVGDKCKQTADHISEVGDKFEQSTDPTSEDLNLKEDENNQNDSGTDDVTLEDNNNTFQSTNQVSTNIDDLDFGINELLLIVHEYEELKEKYLKLETNVESKVKCKCNEQLGDYNISLEKINTLQLENQRLTNEIELLNKKNEEKVSLHEALQNTIDRLEHDVCEQKKDTTVAVEKLSAHDVAAKRAITVLQKEMGTRVEQVTRMYEASVSEKDVYIIKISKLEAAILDLKQTHNNHQKKLSEQDTELERIKNLLKVKETEHIKILSLNEQFEKDIAKLNRRVENHKEEMEGQEIKVKWSQNKLKTELEAHKETKKQLATLTNKLQETKEEGEQIRRDCQEMIERYQGDEEINSVSLRKQLNEEVNKKKELDSVYTKQDQEFQEQACLLKATREDNKMLTQQLDDQKAVVLAVEGKNKNLTNQLSEKEKDCAEMKTLIDSLKEQIKELQEVETKAKRYEVEIKDLRMQVEGLTNQLNECVSDVEEHKEKQQEILQYSQNLTENNVLSRASLNEIQSKLEEAITEKKEICAKFKTLEEDLLSKIGSLTNDKKLLQGNMEDLVSQLDQKAITVNEISSELEETRNELKVMKKKNASQLKDLQRELQQTTRKIEQLESNSNGNGSIESLSNRSRTSSCNSLEKLHATDSPTYSASPNSSSSPQLNHKGVVLPQDHYVTQPNRGTTTRNNNGCQELEIDKKMLVERICKLQKIHAKKNEKIEFLNDHNIQLTDALQKKSRVIQHYFARQEPGIIAPDAFDNNKANISQHGGIMSSVYSAKATDKGMTLELSLTINHKLQAVLEDTVLKNITLQESISTLGMEIAKLQAECKPKT